MSRADMLAYLADLSMHNEREWFHANKTRYTEATREFEALIGALMEELRKFDSQVPVVAPKELTFKLMRDTRFSHDKSPYLPAFRAHIGPKGKLPIPVGYYILVRPDGRSFLGGGLFADQFPDATRRIRDRIAAQGDQWEQILSAPEFRACFTLGGTTLQRVPRGYDPNHPQAAFLRHKSWYLEYPVTDDQVISPDFVPFAAEIFARMKDFHQFLNAALQDFQMPSR